MTMRLQIVASAIVDKYIGESARLIREMFGESQNERFVFVDWLIPILTTYRFVAKLQIMKFCYGSLCGF